jgi:hypothetical protein
LLGISIYHRCERLRLRDEFVASRQERLHRFGYLSAHRAPRNPR